MNKTATIALGVLVSMLAFGEVGFAGSIWARRDSNMKTVYADDVARNIGDILTIKIVEDSKVDNKAKRDLKKETERAGAFSGQVSANGDTTTLPGLSLSTDSTNNLRSTADYKDERTFEDRVSVVVIDILPNGSLVVIGTRDRNIGGDIQRIEVSGIVRPSDITFDNTVKSEQVANFQIVSQNGGISTPYTNPGWLARIVDVIWPW